jgi:hypothetical protein
MGIVSAGLWSLERSELNPDMSFLQAASGTPLVRRAPMARIRSLMPNVTREQAIRQFLSRGPVALFRQAAYGPLRSVAELYIPFRLFRAQVSNHGQTEERLVALDAVSGTLDLFQFDHVPTDAETMFLETRNCPPALLSDPAAVALVIMKLRRLLYSRGFFRLRNFEVDATSLSAEIHVPYWLGFRGAGARAHVLVIDAVRRRLEGAKVRRLVEAWLSFPV